MADNRIENSQPRVEKPGPSGAQTEAYSSMSEYQNIRSTMNNNDTSSLPSLKIEDSSSKPGGPPRETEKQGDHTPPRDSAPQDEQPPRTDARPQGDLSSQTGEPLDRVGEPPVEGQPQSESGNTDRGITNPDNLRFRRHMLDRTSDRPPDSTASKLLMAGAGHVGGHQVQHIFAHAGRQLAARAVGGGLAGEAAMLTFKHVVSPAYKAATNPAQVDSARTELGLNQIDERRSRLSSQRSR